MNDMFIIEMPQILKESVRSSILESAVGVFALKGYHNSTMADIARQAGLSVGNIYRYWPGKEQVLAAVLPDQTVGAIRHMVTTRLEWLADRSEVDPSAESDEVDPARDQAAGVLAWRRILLVLLQNLSGTPWQDFAKDVRDDLVFAFRNWTGRLGLQEPPGWQARLERFYDYLIRQVAEILNSPADDSQLEHELSCLIRYHVAGMTALIKTWE